MIISMKKYWDESSKICINIIALYKKINLVRLIGLKSKLIINPYFDGLCLIKVKAQKINWDLMSLLFGYLLY